MAVAVPVGDGAGVSVAVGAAVALGSREAVAAEVGEAEALGATRTVAAGVGKASSLAARGLRVVSNVGRLVSDWGAGPAPAGSQQAAPVETTINQANRMK
jgi:hypothetical protein